jgi:hypothetical protein
VTVYVISVGLSILDSLRDPGRSLGRDKPELVETIAVEQPGEVLAEAVAGRDRGQASRWLASVLAAPGDPRHDPRAAEEFARLAQTVRPDLWPASISAEVETFAADPVARIPLPASDTAVLVCSDTTEGLLAGTWNAVVLAAGDPGRISYLPAPQGPVGEIRGRVMVVRVPGLDAGDERGFREAMSGLGALGRNLLDSAELGADDDFRFYLSGGFKATIPYLIGLAEGLNSLPEAGPVLAFVRHETSHDSGLIRLPLRRMYPESVRRELKDLTATPSKIVLNPDFLKGYAYEETSGGWQLTAFGAGLKALFGISPPGIGQ